MFNQLSVAIIARNEEKRIGRCLEVLHGWADEIVVVLNDTTDDTEAICHSFGAKVHHRAWSGFKDQKNYAASLCSGTWILSIDADEVLSEELKCEIRDFLNRSAPDYAAVEFPRKTQFMGRWIVHGLWYPDLSLRLYKKEFGQWVGEQYHERLEVNGKVHTATSDLLHYSYESINQQMQKLALYTDMFAQRQIDTGKTCSPLKALGRALWGFSRHYVIKRGFLDGFPGFFIGVLQFWYVFVKYSKVIEHHLIEKKS